MSRTGRTRSYPRLTRRFAENIQPFVKELSEVPIRVLEIGVYTGRTTQWIYENLMKHPDSLYTGIDPWRIEYTSTKRFPRNESGKRKFEALMLGLAEFQRKSNGKITFIKGYSQNVLAPMYQFGPIYDLIYIDGHHTIHSVMRDFVLSWTLLNTNGILVFDDYKMRRNNEVERAVDLIIDGIGPRKKGSLFDRDAKYELLFKNSQYGIRKLKD